MFNTQGRPAYISGMDFENAELVVYAPGTQYPTETVRQKCSLIWKILRGQTLHFNQPVTLDHCHVSTGITIWNHKP